MSLVRIGVSPTQLSKLRKGHNVRVKSAPEGEGFDLIIHPERYSPVTRAFAKGSGFQLKLSPEELKANLDAIPHLAGRGIYDTAKAIYRKHSGLIHKVAAPILKAGAKGALAAGATALGVAQPELLPFIAPGAIGLNAGIDHFFDKHSSNVGGSRAPATHTLAGQVAQSHLYDQMNSHLGTQYGALGQAALGNAAAQMDSARMAPVGQVLAGSKMKAAIGSKEYEHPTADVGFGLYGGSGLYAGASRGGRLREVGSVGRGGNLIHSTPPALQSQPFSANFQFQHTLPPAFQIRGNGLY
jgi:hypothetical protein